MSAYGLARLEHRCVEPGLWMIEGHQVRRLPGKSRTERNPGGRQWVVIRLNGGNIEGYPGRIHPTFESAVETIADHVDKGCDCPPPPPCQDRTRSSTVLL